MKLMILITSLFLVPFSIIVYGKKGILPCILWKKKPSVLDFVQLAKKQFFEYTILSLNNDEAHINVDSSILKEPSSSISNSQGWLGGKEAGGQVQVFTNVAWILNGYAIGDVVIGERSIIRQ